MEIGSFQTQFTQDFGLFTVKLIQDFDLFKACLEQDYCVFRVWITCKHFLIIIQDQVYTSLFLFIQGKVYVVFTVELTHDISVFRDHFI